MVDRRFMVEAVKGATERFAEENVERDCRRQPQIWVRNTELGSLTIIRFCQNLYFLYCQSLDTQHLLTGGYL